MKIIGIDPDTISSGIAIFDKSTRQLEAKSLAFFPLMDYLRENAAEIELVKIEGGWLNKKSNFRFSKSVGIGENIAKKVGANHETGKKIVEMCEYLGINYSIVKPLRKIWKGTDKKITDAELRIQLDRLKINLPNKKTNQDTRDSILICLY